MSTRAQIIITDDPRTTKSDIYFYRHSDGYPKGEHGTGAFLNRFTEAITQGRIRNNAEQAAGFILTAGRAISPYNAKLDIFGLPSPDPSNGWAWKASAHEPSVPYPHGDIEFLYLIDAPKARWCIVETGFNAPFTAQRQALANNPEAVEWYSSVNPYAWEPTD